MRNREQNYDKQQEVNNTAFTFFIFLILDASVPRALLGFYLSFKIPRASMKELEIIFWSSRAKGKKMSLVYFYVSVQMVEGVQACLCFLSEKWLSKACHGRETVRFLWSSAP